MTQILHTADIHLQQVGDKRWQALQTVLSTADDKQVDAVTISGDLFDQDASGQELRDKLRQVFSQHDFPIFILPGNHDTRSFQQGHFFGSNVTIINDSQPQQLDQAAIYGIPFQPLSTKQLNQKIQDLNRKLDPKVTNILLFHGELTDLFFSGSDFGDEGDQRYLPLQLNLLAETNFDYCLAGHFHTNFVVKQFKNKSRKKAYFVYPGSPVSITSKETGQRSTALIRIGQAPEPVKINSHHFQQVQLTFNPEDDLKKFEQLEQQLTNLSAQATALITVTGFFSQEKIGLSEAQLHKKVVRLAQDHNSRFQEKNFTVKEIDRILSSGLFQAFQEKLKQKKLAAGPQQKIESTLIKAMMRTNA